MNYIGTHVLADLYGIDSATLKNPLLLMDYVRSSLERNSYHILNESYYHFTNGGEGVTGFFLLSESHTAFHSYPEFNYLALDIFSCGRNDPTLVLEKIIALLNPINAEKTIRRRAQKLKTSLQTKQYDLK